MEPLWRRQNGQSAERMQNITFAEEALASAVAAFEAEASHRADRPGALHDMIVAMHGVCGELARACSIGVPDSRINELAAPARRIAALSPLVSRLQAWPRGYPGDFETVEYIMQQRVAVPAGTAGYWIELHSLTTGIVQQHRNKVTAQAAHIIHAAQHERVTPVRILVLAAGSSPDVTLAMPILKHANVEVTLVDSDPDAIAFSLVRLKPLQGKVHGVADNVFRAVPLMRSRGPFDLIVAGGLFDYLPTKYAVALVRTTESLLVDDGVFFFTNMLDPNPYHGWMRYVANWTLIERTRDDILSLVRAACGDGIHCEIDVDGTGLALLIKCRKQALGATAAPIQ